MPDADQIRNRELGRIAGAIERNNKIAEAALKTQTAFARGFLSQIKGESNDPRYLRIPVSESTRKDAAEFGYPNGYEQEQAYIDLPLIEETQDGS